MQCALCIRNIIHSAKSWHQAEVLLRQLHGTIGKELQTVIINARRQALADKDLQTTLEYANKMPMLPAKPE